MRQRDKGRALVHVRRVSPAMPAEHELRPGEWVEFAQDVMIDNARSTRTTVDKKTGAGPREVRDKKTGAGPQLPPLAGHPCSCRIAVTNADYRP